MTRREEQTLRKFADSLDVKDGNRLHRLIYELIDTLTMEEVWEDYNEKIRSDGIRWRSEDEAEEV